jgi:hypothetical protein
MSNLSSRLSQEIFIFFLNEILTRLKNNFPGSSGGLENGVRPWPAK